MAIKSFFTPAPTVTEHPPIAVPFLWRSKTNGRIYLRIAPRHTSSVRAVDVILGEVGAPLLGKLDTLNVDDEEAWSLRLSSAEQVVLSNA